MNTLLEVLAEEMPALDDLAITDPRTQDNLDN